MVYQTGVPIHKDMITANAYDQSQYAAIYGTSSRPLGTTHSCDGADKKAVEVRKKLSYFTVANDEANSKLSKTAGSSTIGLKKDTQRLANDHC